VSPPDPHLAELADLGRPRILMVDDRPDALLALEAVLEPLGAELVPARSGIEGLQKLLAGDFAVIILDVQMPEIDGFETARLIRQRERCRYVPIVFLTAISGEPHHFMAGYEAGAFDYLYKPYDPKLLRAKITVLLRLWAKDLLIERQHAELAAQFAQLQAAHAIMQCQAAELERSNAALERLGEAAAAGLRRPLAHARGFLELAMPDRRRSHNGSAAVDADLVQRAVQCLARATAGVDDVRTGARARSLVMGGVPVELATIFADVTDQLADEYPDCRFEASELPSLIGDASLLRQVVYALLAFMARGNSSGRTLLSAGPENDGWRLVVTEEGDGIVAASLVRSLTALGGPGDESAADQVETLAAARRAVECRGGSMGADIVPGQGARLWVRLPVRPWPQPGAQGPVADLDGALGEAAASAAGGGAHR